MHSALVETVNQVYFQKLLSYKEFCYENIGALIKIKGFDHYNSLVDINSIFSSSPKFFPIDRTNVSANPIKWGNVRPWIVPTEQLSLDSAMSLMVKRISSSGEKINVFWSGGIDSTAITTAFLQCLDDLSQLRIIYSPWSYYEHPEYLDFLKKFNQVELIDQSGEVYLTLSLDGIYISGNGSDEIHASIDESFLLKHGYAGLRSSWKDSFFQRKPDTKFMEFCELYFQQAGFEVTTVLEARWFFYTACKVDSILREQTVPFLLATNHHNIPIKNIVGFFNCLEYEKYIYWNINSVIESDDYKTWKQPLKKYCFQFDRLESWYREKSKFHSAQFAHYTQKKIALNNQRYIAILEDGTKIHTPGLPFFSNLEFENKYGNNLDYLFNDSNKV
jgi:hypothetical protein